MTHRPHGSWLDFHGTTVSVAGLETARAVALAESTVMLIAGRAASFPSVTFTMAGGPIDFPDET